MAYIRIKTIRSSTGKVYSYIYVVKSTWIKEIKQSRQTVLHYIGRVENLKHYYVKQVFKNNQDCKHCGTLDNLTVDHIKPLSKGGNNDLTNLQVLCVKCNQKKGSRDDTPKIVEKAEPSEPPIIYY